MFCSSLYQKYINAIKFYLPVNWTVVSLTDVFKIQPCDHMLEVVSSVNLNLFTVHTDSLFVRRHQQLHQLRLRRFRAAPERRSAEQGGGGARGSSGTSNPASSVH